MALTAQQLQQIFAGNNMTPGDVNLNSIYGGVLPSDSGGNASALQEIEQALAAAPSQRWAVDANGQRVDPIGYAPTAGGASMPPMPIARPGAATGMGEPSNGMPLPGMVPGATPIPRAQEPGYQLGDGIWSLLSGGKTALPQGGMQGLLQTLFGGARANTTALPRRQKPSQAYADKNTLAGMRAIENSELSTESKSRASRSRSGGDAHGLTENGNPGWWGS